MQIDITNIILRTSLNYKGKKSYLFLKNLKKNNYLNAINGIDNGEYNLLKSIFFTTDFNEK